VLSKRVTFLYRAIMKYGHFQSAFKEGNTLALKNPPYKDQRYTDSGPYRPLYMLSTFGKVFEPDVVDHLATIAKDGKLLQETQMAARGRSTTNALMFLLEIIRSAGEAGKAGSLGLSLVFSALTSKALSIMLIMPASLRPRGRREFLRTLWLSSRIGWLTAR
jgi:hypothetical protein